MTESLQEMTMYLCTPYSPPMHIRKPDEWRQHAYALAATLVAHYTFNQQLNTFSSIAHWHPIAEAGDLSTDAQTFRDYNFNMIRMCKWVGVPRASHILNSTGVLDEVHYARQLKIPVSILRVPKEIERKWNAYLDSLQEYSRQPVTMTELVAFTSGTEHEKT